MFKTDCPVVGIFKPELQQADPKTEGSQIQSKKLRRSWGGVLQPVPRLRGPAPRWIFEPLQPTRGWLFVDLGLWRCEPHRGRGCGTWEGIFSATPPWPPVPRLGIVVGRWI